MLHTEQGTLNSVGNKITRFENHGFGLNDSEEFKINDLSKRMIVFMARPRI